MSCQTVTRAQALFFVGFLRQKPLETRRPKWVNGAVDEVRLYNRALSQAELAWLAGRTDPMQKPF